MSASIPSSTLPLIQTQNKTPAPSRDGREFPRYHPSWLSTQPAYGEWIVPVFHPSSLTGGSRLRLHGGCPPSPERLERELLPVSTGHRSQSSPVPPCWLSPVYFPLSMPLQISVALIICKSRSLSSLWISARIGTGIIFCVKPWLRQEIFFVLLAAVLAVP